MAEQSDRQRSGLELQALLTWAVRAELTDVPAASMRRAATVLLDDVAAMAAPRDEAELGRVAGRIAAASSPAESTVFVSGRRVARGHAALLNAAACGWMQLDEGYRKTSCHAGQYVLPALLAEAEAADARTDEVMRALVLGYEVVTRIAIAWTRASSPHHVHAQYAAAGAACGIGLLRRLPADMLLDAVCAAATLSPVGPLVQMVEGALVSNFYSGFGAWSGMQAVDMAPLGIAGLPSALHDVFGACRGGAFHAGRLDADLGREWAVDFGFNKRYAACQRLHAGADALLALLPSLPGHERGRRIRQMVVATHDPQLDGHEPRNGLATRFSFPHVMAAMVALGHGEADAFGSTSLDDPDIAALRQRVKVVRYDPPRPWPHDRAVRVSVTMDDGRVFEHEAVSARGSPEQPLTEAEILQKARALSEPTWPMLVSTLEGILERPSDPSPATWRGVVAGLTTGAD